MSAALEDWLTRWRFSGTARDAIVNAAETPYDLRDAPDHELEEEFRSKMKPLSLSRLLKAVRALRAGEMGPPTHHPVTPPPSAALPVPRAPPPPLALPSPPKKRKGAPAADTAAKQKAKTGKLDCRSRNDRLVRDKVNAKLKHKHSAALRFVAANPKAALESETGQRAAARYEQYKGARTVGEFYAAGGSTADLMYDIARGYCAVLDEEYHAWEPASAAGAYRALWEAAAPPAPAPAPPPGWTSRFGEVVWVKEPSKEKDGFRPWPAMILEPDEAKGAVRQKAEEYAGAQYLVWNYGMDSKYQFSFVEPARLVRWAAGHELGFHRWAWTGKYAESFPEAVKEAGEAYSRTYAEATALL